MRRVALLVVLLAACGDEDTGGSVADAGADLGDEAPACGVCVESYAPCTVEPAPSVATFTTSTWTECEAIVQTDSGPKCAVDDGLRACVSNAADCACESTDSTRCIDEMLLVCADGQACYCPTGWDPAYPSACSVEPEVRDSRGVLADRVSCP